MKRRCDRLPCCCCWLVGGFIFCDLKLYIVLSFYWMTMAKRSVWDTMKTKCFVQLLSLNSFALSFLSVSFFFVCFTPSNFSLKQMWLKKMPKFLYLSLLQQQTMKLLLVSFFLSFLFS